MQIKLKEDEIRTALHLYVESLFGKELDTEITLEAGTEAIINIDCEESELNDGIVTLDA